MTTLLLHHPACLEHGVPPGHPERPARLTAILDVLAAAQLAGLRSQTAPAVTDEALSRVHTTTHLARIEQTAADLAARAEATGQEGSTPMAQLDPDTWMTPGSLAAARRAAGAVVHAVDAVMAGEAANAFCAVRPPGHHAEAARAMGFCLFNNVAVGAAHALHVHDLARVAIVDFDVHHGNGTEAIFRDEPRVMYLSTHQWPAYPGTGAAEDQGMHGNVINCPLPPGTDGVGFRRAVEARILPALEDFAPQIILVSAGFDAHADDPLAGLRLTEADFAWITLRIAEMAARHARGRLISVLEGGYDLRALAASAAAHVRVLTDAAGDGAA